VNPLAGIAHMLGHPFVRYAFVAGSAVAVAAGLAGYFLVLRSQVFTADALSHVAVAGAMAALAFGVDARLGLFVATVAVALGMGLLGPRGRPDDVVIGSVFAWILGLGVLFLTLYTRSRSTSNSTAGVTVLFGSVFGLSRSHALAAAGISAGTVVVLLLIARPLLFATIDEEVARSRGLPVTALGLGFLALAGVTAAEATQVVGALLLLGLVASRPAPDDAPLPGDVALGGPRPWGDVGGTGAQLCGPETPAELRRHRDRCGFLPARSSGGGAQAAARTVM
jgi:zinc/manganese transport system permease protein